METFLFYILRASIAAAILYICYKVFIGRITFHRLNRVAIWAILAVSLILPLFTIQLPALQFFAEEKVGTIDLSAFQNIPITTERIELPSPKAEIHWIMILSIIYTLGVGICTLRYFSGALKMAMIIRSARKESLNDGSSIYVSKQNIAPFSWMRFIVISEKDFTDVNADIIHHEKAHVKHRHSLDLMWADVYSIAFWFNPFAWLLRNELRNIHEYQADDEVVKNRNDFREYQLLLIRHCVGEHKFSIANNFEFNNLQKRIKMIMKTKSSNRSKWLYTSLVLSTFVAIMILSVESLQAKVPAENEKKSEKTALTDSLKGEVTGIKVIKFNYEDDADTLNNKTRTVIVRSREESKNGKVTLSNEVSSLSNPLFIVDGLEVEDISNIAPKTIASVSVLKDKKSTEIYGEKGKNGVVIITTKNKITDPKADKGNADIVIKRVETKKTKSEQVLSLNGKEDSPVIILDGLEIANEQMKDLSPELIESVTVLKDKASTEIYGDKGKNGVVIIQSKVKKTPVKPAFEEQLGLNTKTEPLYIKDGTPISKEEFGKMNPNEIESLSVLKNQSATAVYGEKGKNGVILITTKRGNVNSTSKSAGNSRMSFSANSSKGDKKINFTVNDDEIVSEGIDDNTTAIFIDGKLANKKQLDALNPKHIVGGSLGSKDSYKDLVKKHNLKQEWIFLINTNPKLGE